MKYILVFLIFIGGFLVGRWTTNSASQKQITESGGVRESEINLAAEILATQNPKALKSAEGNLSAKASIVEANQILAPTKHKPSGNRIKELFDLFVQVHNAGDLENRNKLVAEMQALDRKHEKVFESQATILEDDENWDGAHKVYEDCITTIPNSLYCLRRLANIRSSTVEDKLRYGTECLQIAKDDPVCLVDVALALNTRGEFAKAKQYFEQALSLPLGNEGFKREYVLYQYALSLESLRLDEKAKAALGEACQLRMEPACERLRI